MKGDSGAAARPVTVTVQPQATTTTQPPKTPEQMEEEAKGNGWLHVWGEPTGIWPPWYLLHVNVTIGGATIHVAFNPVLPFWPGIVEFSGLETLLPTLPSTPQPPSPPPPPPDETSRILTGIVTKVILGALGLATVAVATANIPPLPAAIAAMVVYGIGSAYFIYDAIKTYYSSEWGAHTKAWAKFAGLLIAFAGAAVAVEMSFSAGAVFKSLLVPVLSAFLANFIDAASLDTALVSTCYSIWIGLFAVLAALKIPNPLLSNVYFRPAFLILNLLLVVSVQVSLLALPL
jgi:hypothetical protein